MKTLLVPIDFSSVTPRVVDEAAALAIGFGARLVLLNVTEPTASVVDYAVISVSVAQVDQVGVKRAKQQLEDWRARLDVRGIVTETVHVVGSPVEEIVEQAEKLPADYLIVGSHGHGAIYDLLVGSTTTGILKRARCPVVIVPAAAERRDALSLSSTPASANQSE